MTHTEIWPVCNIIIDGLYQRLMGKMISFKEYSLEFDLCLESVEYTEEELTQLDEVLDTASRIKLRNTFARRGARLRMQRKLQRMKVADTKRLIMRAHKRARRLLIKRMYQGRTRSQIPISQRKQLDTRLHQMQGRLNSLSQLLLRRVRQEDIARKNKKKLGKFNAAGFVRY